MGLLSLASFVGSAHAQTSPATIDPERKYSYPDSQAVVDLMSAYDGTGGWAGRRYVYAGAEATSLLAGGGGMLPASFDSYCVQLGTSIQRPSESVTVGPMDGSFNLGKAAVNPSGDYGGAIGWLYNHYAGVAADQSQTSAQMSAALQLSIWEVEYNWNGTGLSGISTTLDSTDGLGNPLNYYYEGNPTQTTPTVTFDPAITQVIRADANTILTNWNGQTDDVSTSFLDGRSSNSQSLVGPRVVRTVPEPATMALLFCGIAPIALRKRKRA